ncbi:MAG: hypothetical protein ACM31O_21000 [Bacteroidota bacterium]
MRIVDDLIKCVVFFGYEDPDKPGGINCVGTGFLLSYDHTAYLVTARHLSNQLGADPFLLRVNRKDGTAENLHADNVKWFDHSDPLVDVSIANLHISKCSKYEAVYMDGEKMLVTPHVMKEANIGVGNFTYTIGLFRLLSGKNRNLPICHCGTIALIPGDERVPVIDWTDKNPVASQRRRIQVEAYLVEAQSIGGLSGSPVFVRAEHEFDFARVLVRKDMPHAKVPTILACDGRMRLLGLWQGAWEARPDEVRAAESNALVVPLGMGVVVPAIKIIEVLERDDVKKEREAIKASRNLSAAQTQAVPVTQKPSAGTAPSS